MVKKVDDKDKDNLPHKAISELIRKDFVQISTNKNVEVRLCKVRDIPVFVSFLGTMFSELGIDITQANSPALEEQVRGKLRDGGFILKLISNNFDEAARIIDQFTDMAYEEFADLDLDDAAAIVLRLVEVNYDFFMVRVLPLVRNGIRLRKEEPEAAQAKI